MVKPTKPRGSGKKANKPAGVGKDRGNPRQPGRQDYTRDQTDRYKGRDGRLDRADKLLQNFDSRVYQVAEGNINYYYIASSDNRVAQSASLPTVGTRYHRVTCDRDKPAPTPAPAPPGLPDQPPAGGGTPGVNPNTVYVSDLATGLGGLPAGWVSAKGAQVNYNGLKFPDIGTPVITGSPFVGSVNGINGWAIETLGNYSGQTLLQLEAANIPYWLRSNRIFTRANGATDIITSYKYVGPAPQPALYTPASTTIEYKIKTTDINFSVAVPLVFRGAADDYTASPLTPIGGGGSPPTPGTPQPPEIPPLDPPVNPPNSPGRYSCTCPDFTRQEAADPSSGYRSRWQSRGWENTAAGTDDYCYHIMAIAQREGDDIL